jgi:hypothetical protein
MRASARSRREQRVVRVVRLVHGDPPGIGRGCTHNAEALPQQCEWLHPNFRAAEHPTTHSDGASLASRTRPARSERRLSPAGRRSS